MRRLLSSMIVVVLLPLFVLPGFAWDKYSFVGDSAYSLRHDLALPSVQSVQAQAVDAQADSVAQSLDYDTILPNMTYDGGVSAVFATTLHTLVGDVEGVQWVPSSRVQMTYPTVASSGSYHVYMDGRPYV